VRQLGPQLHPVGLPRDEAAVQRHLVAQVGGLEHLQAGALLGTDPASLQAAFEPHAARPLGHISAGLGRDGQPCMTWYWEVEALP
jgi:hypothetical protein